MSGERSDTKIPGKARASGKQPAGSAAEGKRADDLAEVTRHAGELVQEAWRSSNDLLQQAAHLVHTLRRGHEELGHQLTDVSAARPYVAIGTAAGLGFVLGGGLTLALTRRLLGLGGRLAVSVAMRRVMQGASQIA